MVSVSYLTKNKNNEINANIQSANFKELDINLTNFEEIILRENKEYYLWFCDVNDDSCKYLEREYINPFLKKLDVDSFIDLTKVEIDLSSLSKEKLKSKFNIESKLAFVKAIKENGVITYENALSWDDEKPFSKDDLKAWLYENNIWQSTYDAKGK